MITERACFFPQRTVDFRGCAVLLNTERTCMYVTETVKLTRMSIERFSVSTAVRVQTALREVTPFGLLRIYRRSTVTACRWRQ
jgi:hypothetical protein